MLQYRAGGTMDWQDQPLELLAFDGVSQVDDNGSPNPHVMVTRQIVLQPASRAESVIAGSLAGTEGHLYSDDYNRHLLSTNPNPKAIDNTDPQPARVLAQIASVPMSLSAASTRDLVPREVASERVARFIDMRQAVNPRNRTFFFSKDLADEGNFFLTSVRQTPQPFAMDAPPAVTVHMPTVEDWTIENRDDESHVFHIHQIHIRVLEVNGVAVDEQATSSLRDTIEMPACRDRGNADPDDPYANDPTFTGKNCKEPSRLKLRMDFRETDIAGMSLFHCHILEHQDKGMMAKIDLVWDPQAAQADARLLREHGLATLEERER